MLIASASVFNVVCGMFSFILSRFMRVSAEPLPDICLIRMLLISALKYQNMTKNIYFKLSFFIYAINYYYYVIRCVILLHCFFPVTLSEQTCTPFLDRDLPV